MEEKPDRSWNAASIEATDMEKEGDSKNPTSIITETPINPSGHRQELDRNFNLLSICSFGITSGNTWIALGGSLTVAIYNGGPPGVIYEFIVVSVMYWAIAASLAELASAMPSAGGVYHWSSITAGRYGRACGFFAGWWNFFAWLIGVAVTAQIIAAQAVSMYSIFHADFVTQKWHVFVAYIIVIWLSAFVVILANRTLPLLQTFGGFLVIAGVFITIIVCASMAPVHASNAFVWRDWLNSTGYGSDGFAFVLGMLNGAFAVGTPDVVSHLAEEIPKPSQNIPKAILAQFIISFITGFTYLIAILYSISDLEAVLDSPYLFPLTEIYRQATDSAGGTLGLLLLCILPFLIGLLGCWLTSSRIFWTLARDNATPFASFFAQVNKKNRNPSNAILFCAALATVLGCIYLGSSTAFNAFAGSFVILTILSYLGAILPHLLSGRSGITSGWFWMKGPLGFVVNAVACLFIMAFVVIFCFPFSLPVSAATMNYASLMIGGLSLFVAVFWFWRQKDYSGPTYVAVDSDILAPNSA